MKMYSLYGDGTFLGKYVRKDWAISDILDMCQMSNGKTYRDMSEDNWIVVKNDKIMGKYEIKKEEV